MGVEEEGKVLSETGVTEAFPEQPAECRGPVGDGGRTELADRVGSGVTLFTRHEFKLLQNSPSFTSRGPEIAPLGNGLRLAASLVKMCWHIICSVSQCVIYRRCLGNVG